MKRVTVDTNIFIVSGDKDHSELETYQGILIVTPSDFLALLNPPTETPADESATE